MRTMIKGSSLRRNSQVVYASLVQYLARSIRQGKLAPGEQIPPENLLAERFGISRSSVRLGLNLLENQGSIVKRAGKGTFVRNIFEENPSDQQAIRTIGINVIHPFSSMENWYDSKIMNALQPACQKQNHRLSLFSLDQIPELRKELVDALILLYYNSGVDELIRLQKNGLESVLFNRIVSHEKIAYVSVNYLYESENAVRMLRRQGHEKIGMIFGQRDQVVSLREQGYLNAIEAAVSPSDRTCQVENNQSMSYYTEKIEQFLREKHQNMTALFIVNGSLAAPVFQACRNLNIRVPEDLTLLCFDDIAYLFDMYHVPFQYIRMPLAEMAVDAVSYLTRKMQNPQEPVLKRLYPVEIMQKNNSID